MREPIVVVVRRGSVVEARHRVHAVVVRDGEIVESAGNPSLVSFLRSSSKPIQALPLARAREDLDDRELAIACASHRAEPAQLDAVRRLLAAAPARERELECGIQEGRPPDALHHNCSGKHAGMLALCRARGWPSAGYSRADHPLQQAMLAVHAEAAEAAPEEIPTAIDGCGVPTFALPLERMAHSFARIERLAGGAEVAAAMRAHPELVGGPDAADTELMQRLPGWIAKGGAEGLLCLAGPDGLGVALKTLDGASRAHRPAVASLLGTLGYELADWLATSVANSRGETVGELAVRA